MPVVTYLRIIFGKKKMNEIFYKKKWQKRAFLFKFYYKNKMALEIEAKIIKEERYKALVLIYPYIWQIPNIILLLISLKKSENKSTSHYF